MENPKVKNSIEKLINLDPEIAKETTISEYVDLIFLKNVRKF